MTKVEFEDLLRRAGKIARDRDFFLIGSQSLRGTCPAIPRDFPKTIEADLYPRHHPQAWSLLRMELGNQSKFFTRRGYFLDCTDPALATLPEGWIERLIPFRTPRTGGVTAWCLDPNDLFAAKLVAWREKDQQFLRAMLNHKLARPAVILDRIQDLPIAPRQSDELTSRLAQLVAESRANRAKPRRKK
jgi:hypothetical protein